MNSGIRHLQIRDSEQLTTFPAVVQYPTHCAPEGVMVGPYHFDGTLDAPLAEGRFPLCVVSHGGGGSHLLYRSIGTYLAARGYIVVSLEHPGDNRNDRSQSNTELAALNRPRHASLAIDAVIAHEVLGSAVNDACICAIGHSMGGYTALALVGGRPWSRSGHAIAVRSDSRVRAAVLLAPSTDWFLAPDSLASVSVPLLVIAGEHDRVTPPENIRRALAGLTASTALTLQVVPGAGHYSFLTPFPEHMRRADFLPSTDPDGFDRDQFHTVLPPLIHEFLKESL